MATAAPPETAAAPYLSGMAFDPDKNATRERAGVRGRTVRGVADRWRPAIGANTTSAV